MATTTNYAWETPDDTDLVKDGAAAIRTLGSSIDTTTKALNPSTTLGDIEYRSSTANTNTRLGIGSSGNVLTVTGGVPVWAAPASGGGMTLLSTTTLSGANTTISSISGSYNTLVVVVSGISVSSNAFVEIQPNATSTSITIASIASNPSNNDAIKPQSFTNSTLYLDGDDVIKASNTDNAFCVTFDNYASASYYKPVQSYGSFTNSSTLRQSIIRMGAFQSTTAISSLKFVTSAGTFGAGQVLVYGVK